MERDLGVPAKIDGKLFYKLRNRYRTHKKRIILRKGEWKVFFSFFLCGFFFTLTSTNFDIECSMESTRTEKTEMIYTWKCVF